MLRQRDTRPLHWADKTMSVLRAEQLEACEKDLAGLPSRCLFEQECGNVDAEKLYDTLTGIQYGKLEDRNGWILKL